MLDVRDAMLVILDRETLAELAARDGALRSTGPACTPMPRPATVPETVVVQHAADRRVSAA